MEDDFLFDSGFSGSTSYQSNQFDAMAKHILSLNDFNSDAFQKGLKSATPDESEARETIKKWQGYESFA